MMGALAGPLAAIVLDGLAGPLRVLDIAAGHGLFGIELAKVNPEAHITALDWAAVLEVARGNASKAGVEGRYHPLPGSAFDVEYGRPYDICPAHELSAPFRPACMRWAAAEGACGIAAGRPGGGAGIRAQ
jgi:Methyltransferase domain